MNLQEATGRAADECWGAIRNAVLPGVRTLKLPHGLRLGGDRSTASPTKKLTAPACLPGTRVEQKIAQFQCVHPARSRS
jgi:hypothetical protein